MKSHEDEKNEPLDAHGRSVTAYIEVETHEDLLNSFLLTQGPGGEIKW